jgi:hypothetical protein
VLSLVMEKTRAWELLHDPEYCGRLDVVGMRDLMLRAGYPTEVVREAVNRHGEYRLNNNMVL